MSLTRFDPIKGCFVLAGEKPMNRPVGCTCHPDSPFLWAHNLRASFAMQEKTMRAQGKDNLSRSQVSALANSKQRAEGKDNSRIFGLGRDREAEVTRMRDFVVYSKVRKEKA